MDDKISININLSLSKEELLQFYWNAFGISLVKLNNAPLAHEGYNQILQQLESFFIKENPDNIFKLDTVKERIKKSILDSKKNN